MKPRNQLWCLVVALLLPTLGAAQQQPVPPQMPVVPTVAPPPSAVLPVVPSVALPPEQKEKTKEPRTPAIDYSGKEDMVVTDQSPLVRAIVAQNTQDVRKHIADVNKKTDDDSYPIIVAAQHANAQIAIILTGHKARVHVKDSHGRSAMHYAAMRGQVDQIKLLSALDAKVDEPDDKGITPLYYALLNNKVDAAQTLKDNGVVNVNRKGLDGDALAFLVVANNDYPEAVKWMLENGLNVFMRNARDKTLMKVARKQGNGESQKLLKDAYDTRLREYIEKQKTQEKNKPQKKADE